MGVTSCPDCRATVSDSATACPSCGRKMLGATLVGELGKLVVGVLLVATCYLWYSCSSW